MQRYKLTVEYDGTPYHGWQRQKGLPSVQEAIEKAIFKFCQQEVRLQCSGRTDAGVHAWAQIAHADLSGGHDSFTVQQALNAHLRGEATSITQVELVDDTFHARFSAKKRYYEYHIINRRPPPMLDALRAWHFVAPLDIDKMRAAAQHLIGTHDFSSFRDSDCQAKTPVKTVDTITIASHGERIIISVDAQSFLHHQVRIMTGTLAMVGKGKMSPDAIPDMIAAKSRCASGMTAPAHGLYFMHVDY